jgi:hypothetical protein
MKTCQMPNCSNTYPSAKRINGKKYNFGSRKYCFECSPVGEHKIRSRAKNVPLYESCDLCNRVLNSKTWANRKRCNSCQVKIHRITKKIRAINLLGGRCVECGWTPQTVFEVSAIEFHHPNKNKDFDVGRYLNKKWDSLVSEILKCQLLCSRCHRIHHSRRDENLEKIVNQKVRLDGLDR